MRRSSKSYGAAPEPRVIAWFEGLADDVAITAVTVAELLAGVRRLPGGRRTVELLPRIDAAIESFRASRSNLAFDDKAASS